MRKQVVLIVGVGLFISACSAATDAQVSTSESVASITEAETLTVHIGQLTATVLFSRPNVPLCAVAPGLT